MRQRQAFMLGKLWIAKEWDIRKFTLLFGTHVKSVKFEYENTLKKTLKNLINL